jgi:hypothetical protein
MEIKEELLKSSTEQAKARIACDVLRFVNRSDGGREYQLYSLAANYLVTYFGGIPEPVETEDVG